MAIEIVDFPIKNGDFPWQNVSSPEGNHPINPQENPSSVPLRLTRTTTGSSNGSTSLWTARYPLADKNGRDV